MSNDAWERAYVAGKHEHQWDTPWSSPELAGYLAALDELPCDVLDLGCGTGGDAIYFASNGISTTGLDVSPTALDLARQRADSAGVTVSWIEGDVLDLPFPDASFDLLTDRGCLHHIAVGDQPRYAAEAARVLRPGGRLLIREMNEAGRHKHAITEEAIAAMIDGVPLRMHSALQFEMVGQHGHRRATIAVIVRDGR